MVKELIGLKSNNYHMLFKNSCIRNNNPNNQNTTLLTFKNYVMIAHLRNYFNNF